MGWLLKNLVWDAACCLSFHQDAHWYNFVYMVDVSGTLQLCHVGAPEETDVVDKFLFGRHVDGRQMSLQLAPYHLNRIQVSTF